MHVSARLAVDVDGAAANVGHGGDELNAGLHQAPVARGAHKRAADDVAADRGEDQADRKKHPEAGLVQQDRRTGARNRTDETSGGKFDPQMTIGLAAPI